MKNKQVKNIDKFYSIKFNEKRQFEQFSNIGSLFLSPTVWLS